MYAEMLGRSASRDGELDERHDGDRRSRSLPTPLRRFLTPENRLTDEEAFGILSNPRRRYTMEFLHRRDRPCSMERLVERTAAAENGVPIEELDKQQCRRVYVSLYQTHLPLLDEAGAIEYDRETQRIVPGPAAAELLPYLDTPTERAVPWRTYYLRLFLAYATVGGVVVVGLISAPSVPTLTLLGVVLFLALACLHGFERRS